MYVLLICALRVTLQAHHFVPDIISFTIYILWLLVAPLVIKLKICAILWILEQRANISLYH